MSETFNDLPNELGPEFQQRILRADLLWSATKLRRNAEEVDGLVSALAVDQYNQSLTDETADMPIGTSRILLQPNKREEIVEGIAEAYVYFPGEGHTQSESQNSRIIFIRTVESAAEQMSYMITPERFLAFRSKDELQVDPSIRDLVDISVHDPSTLFNYRPLDSAYGDMTVDQQGEKLELLNRILRTYKLKSLPPKSQQIAS